MSEVFQSHWFYEIGPLHEETVPVTVTGAGQPGCNLRSDEESRLRNCLARAGGER